MILLLDVLKPLLLHGDFDDWTEKYQSGFHHIRSGIYLKKNYQIHYMFYLQNKMVIEVNETYVYRLIILSQYLFYA